ncbi:PIN-like domain-containing protein [Pseudomonas sp. RL_5y_Pfl2_70]|uniref:PIN-like domain-containing protein n=1 Tax=Pseudomonas sp. RL_5y_Pfl2_70 TaxID=3088712 RepID=UPI0030D95DA1
MKTLFPSHFASDQNRIITLWSECIFVFDTNVLTGMYKYSDETRDALYQVIESLGERLWIPYQVILEYLDNRAKIVHDQSKLYTSAIEKLENFKAELENPTRHPFVLSDIYEEFCTSTEKVLEDLRSRRALHEGRIATDDIKARLAELLDGKIGPKYSAEALDALSKEGDIRYSQKIPPGFEDRDKHKGSTLTKEVNKRYGDLIFWKQILDRSKETSTSVILVTGERKEDWWSICGGKTIGPLPELMDEFSEITGKDFYIYSTHSFLKLANDYLHQHTSTAAVEEVRDSFITEKQLSDSEQNLIRPIDDFEEIETNDSNPRTYDISYYQQKELLIEASLTQMDLIIQNIRNKLSEAELVASPNVIEVYKNRLSHSLRRRKSLRIRQRYYSRKISQMLNDLI